ncbi:GrpE nucleotide exchange factor [Dillenia turbinata]|uniref:GrpE protein homolog n=1 Tax=Dillenia turbinata TaxID=194707 RepID=A0AAN8VR19_9MAGN
MSVARVLSRVSKLVSAAHSRDSNLLASLLNHHIHQQKQQFSVFSYEPFLRQLPLLHQCAPNASILQSYGFFSSTSPQADKESGQTGNDDAKAEPTNTSEDAKASDQADKSGSNSESQAATGNKRRRRGTKRIAFSDSDSEEDLSRDDLVKLVAEKEELLKMKHKEIEKMQDKVLRSYAEMENVMDRTRREAENSKKFAIQNFAKSLLDVADNLGRASSVVKESFSKIDVSKDSAGAVPLLKTLLEGVEMTEKQLAEVFKKYGIEKYDPLNEQFDPHRHNAVFQIPDGSKVPGTVAVVLKPGYMLYDRVIRPAEVGVVQEVNNNQAEQGSDA